MAVQVSSVAERESQAQVQQEAERNGASLNFWLLLAAQLYLAGTYLVTTVAQYGFFRDSEPWITSALSAEGAADPLALLFVVPGWWVTLLSGPVFALAALCGGAATAARWAQLSRAGRAWGVAGAAVCAFLFVVGLTSVGNDMAVWIAG